MKSTDKNALVIGATGLIGSSLVNQLVQNTKYKLIYVIGRTKPMIESSKIRFIYAELAAISGIEINDDIDEVYCTLGTTIKKAKSKEAFKAVDFDAVVELAKWAVNKNVPKFSVVSSIGANGQSNNFYLRTKGQMENRLKQMGLYTLIIVRPSLLLGKRKEIRVAEKIGEFITRLLSPLFIGTLKKYRAIQAETVAKAMIKLNESKFGDIFIVESDQLSLLN